LAIFYYQAIDLKGYMPALE